MCYWQASWLFFLIIQGCPLGFLHAPQSSTFIHVLTLRKVQLASSAPLSSLWWCPWHYHQRTVQLAFPTLLLLPFATNNWQWINTIIVVPHSTYSNVAIIWLWWTISVWNSNGRVWFVYTQLSTCWYCIVGSFRMVQNFTVFMDRLAIYVENKNYKAPCVHGVN